MRKKPRGTVSLRNQLHDLRLVNGDRINPSSGQTGAGKTFTTIGSEEEGLGLLPRVLEEIFAGIEMDSAEIFVSFYEVYNDKVRERMELIARIGVRHVREGVGKVRKTA